MQNAVEHRDLHERVLTGLEVDFDDMTLMELALHAPPPDLPSGAAVRQRLEHAGPLVLTIAHASKWTF